MARLRGTAKAPAAPLHSISPLQQSSLPFTVTRTADKMITGIAHINVLVPPESLDHAEAFYGGTLGLSSAPVPHLQKGTILWCAAFLKTYPGRSFILITAGLISAIQASKCTSRRESTRRRPRTATRASSCSHKRSYLSCSSGYGTTMSEGEMRRR